MAGGEVMFVLSVVADSNKIVDEVAMLPRRIVWASSTTRNTDQQGCFGTLRVVSVLGLYVSVGIRVFFLADVSPCTGYLIVSSYLKSTHL